MTMMAVGSGVSILLWLTTLPAAAQDLEIPPAEYPALPRLASTAEGFAPSGWKVEAEVRGDLNRDGLADLALVLRPLDPKNLLANQGLGVQELDTNPRILAVAFAEKDTQQFRLALENHTLIPRHESPTLDDAFEADGGLTVQRGAFSVALSFFASAGSWTMSRSTLTFRWQNGRFELIGFDDTAVQRDTAAMETRSANFSTGRMRIETEEEGGTNRRVRWRALPKKRFSIEEVGNGLEFDPTPELPRGN